MSDKPNALDTHAASADELRVSHAQTQGDSPEIGEHAAPDEGVTDVREKYAEYLDDDSEEVQEWKKRRHVREFSPFNVILMLAVLAFVPWYIYNDRQDIAYFFSSRTPAELGNADAYHRADSKEAKAQDFPDNSYVHISGIPIRHLAIQTGGFFGGRKLVYELMGSSVYIQEDFEHSRFAAFQAQTTPTLAENQGIEPISVSGRLQRFDTDKAKNYDSVRKYYHQKYGTIFCANMTDDERRLKAAHLGRGGIAQQIMPDGSVIEGVTDTRATLTEIVPLRGREALAVGKDRTLLQTIDAGLTWRKATMPIAADIVTAAYDAATGNTIFGGSDGYIGGAQDTRDPNDMILAQGVEALTFTHAPADNPDAPKIIAAGRAGLLLTASPNREGWTPAVIDGGLVFNGIVHSSNIPKSNNLSNNPLNTKPSSPLWFAVGSQSMLMTRPNLDNPSDSAPISWTRGVSPVEADWLGVTAIPRGAAAVGTKGAMAWFDTQSPVPAWHSFPVDDVPGIDFNDDLRSSAISGDGRTWAAVGKNGAIVTAQFDESGAPLPAKRVSGSFAGYAIIEDLLAGKSINHALSEALHRHTAEDLNSIAWNNGRFYAVGTESTLMSSPDGISWTKHELPVQHKRLHAIAFIDQNSGIIAGERGLMLVSDDGGNSWKTRTSPTERTISALAVSPDFPGGFVFAGAGGLWGLCQGVHGACYMRTKTADFQYRSIAIEPGPQDAAHLKVAAAGSKAVLRRIHDAPGSQGRTTPLWTPIPAEDADIFAAAEPLPFVPDSAQGHVFLISAGNGSMFRSADSGFTFRREETGASAALTRITATPNGTVVWTFDGKGTALCDERGRGKWKPILGNDNEKFIDGVISNSNNDANGYLIDSRCIYMKSLRSDDAPAKIACLPDNSPNHFNDALESISADGSRLFVTVRRADGLHTGSVSDNHEQISVDARIIPDHARLIACGGTLYALDRTAHTLSAPQGSPMHSIADAACMDGALTVLSAEPISGRPGMWRIAAVNQAPIWSVNVGFDASNARFAHTPDGRWWIAAADRISTRPRILMSLDGKKWSWQSDRITDFHDVASAQNMAVAVGDFGSILVSDDFGASWTQIPTSSQNTLRGVCLSQDGSFGLAVGDNNTIYRSDDGLSHWSKLIFKQRMDITSCTVAEQKDRFQIYLTGKDGAIYTSQNKEMSSPTLVQSPSVEDMYSIAALETGEVIAVGGVYQDPDSICENGYLIDADETPGKQWPAILIAFIMILFWIYTAYVFYVSWKYKRDHIFDAYDN